VASCFKGALCRYEWHEKTLTMSSVRPLPTITHCRLLTEEEPRLMPQNRQPLD
jgi:hypothetical protein